MPNNPRTGGSTSFLTEDHQLSLGEAHQVGATITAYGKVIKDFTLSPSEASTTHPQGLDADLQLALVYGIQDQGRCIRLSQPKKVYLPAPDGPADGCDWDPTQFVAWKKLPRDWATLQVQTQRKPLALAFQSRDASQIPALEDVLKQDWLKSTQPTHINSVDQLGALWVKFGPGGDFDINAQNKLASVIQDAFGVNLSPTSLTATMTFSQLRQLVGVD